MFISKPLNAIILFVTIIDVALIWAIEQANSNCITVQAMLVKLSMVGLKFTKYWECIGCMKSWCYGSILSNKCKFISFALKNLDLLFLYISNAEGQIYITIGRSVCLLSYLFYLIQILFYDIIYIEIFLLMFFYNVYYICFFFIIITYRELYV